jgi:hypothetical protein
MRQGRCALWVGERAVRQLTYAGTRAKQPRGQKKAPPVKAGQSTRILRPIGGMGALGQIVSTSVNASMTRRLNICARPAPPAAPTGA